VARYCSAFFAHRPGGLFILGKIFDRWAITANLILPGRKLEMNLRTAQVPKTAAIRQALFAVRKA
jgi:hypothetical protein